MRTFTDEEIKAWWDEFAVELAKLVVPNGPPRVDPPPPTVPKIGESVLKKGGNTYYTLADDVQFPTEKNNPNSIGWN